MDTPVSETDEMLEEGLKKLREDRSSGASQLARGAVALLGEVLEAAPFLAPEGFVRIAARTARRIAGVRPSMTPLRLAAARVLAVLREAHAGGADLEALKKTARAACREEEARSLKACETIAETAAGMIRDGETLFTHSVSSSCLALARRLAGRPLSFIVSESRPLCEGQRTARGLAGLGFRTTLVTDALGPFWVRRADRLVVGADTLLPDGGVVNKAGTYALALAAREAGVPVVVLAETWKIAPAGGEAPELEEMAPEEVAGNLPEGVEIRNVYFDSTPPELIGVVITEEGPLAPGEIFPYAERHRRLLAALEE